MRLQFLLKKQVFLKVQNPCRPGRIRRKWLRGSLLDRIRATPRGWGARHTSVEKFHTCAPTGRPGGVLPPLPPGLSPAAGRSPSTPASGPLSDASTGQPDGAFYRTAGRAAGRSSSPLPPGLFRAPQQGNRTEPFTGRPGGRPEALRHPVPMPCGGGCAEPARRRSRKGRK